LLDGGRCAELVTMGSNDFGKIKTKLDGGRMVALQNVVEGFSRFRLAVRADGWFPMFPALFLESVRCRELVVNQFRQMIFGCVTIETRGFREPLPGDIAQCGWGPRIFGTKVLVKSGNCDGFTISCMIVLMNGAMRGDEHTRAGREKG